YLSVCECWAALLSSCLFFIITAIIVKVPLEPLTFFCLTMVKIVIINCACSQSRKDSLLLPGMIECHVIFIPLFMLCNVQPHLHLPVLFYHDAFFILFMTLFAFSNGYLASLCMCFGPK
ncbi:Equilibrative nucleoside transporter 1, partial [Takifugu flavidus]